MNPQLKNLTTPKLTKYIPVKLTSKQEAFLWLTCRNAFYGGAAGGGKTIALLAAALQYVDIPGYNAILIRDTYSNLSKPDSLMDVADKWLIDTDAVWHGDDKKWTFPSGATLSFGYLDGPRDHFNYQSAQYQFVGIDEIVNIRENQATYMHSRTRKLEGSQIPLRFRCASNPPTEEQVARGQWVKTKYVDPKTRDPRVVFIPSKMEDNPHLNVDDYKKSLAFLDPVTRQQLEDGDWEIQAAGHMFKKEWFEIVNGIEGKINKVVRFWDLAATDPKKIPETAKSKNKPAYTSGTLMARTENFEYIILDINRFQKSPGGVERIIKQTAELDGKGVEICMEQEGGSGGKNTIYHYRNRVLPGFIFYGIPVSGAGSKIERARPLSSNSEAGGVKLLAGAWIKDFLDEIVLFPNGEFKDQVDSTSGAFNRLASSGAFRVDTA
ncbi:phage terminase large subunit [Candidatus Woesearchaeota archaeon]|nr:phage terminase large subunit [Candidatus Woesearchaeota archaeon]